MPHTVRILLPPGMPITEMATTLVIPELLRTLQIEVDATFERKPGLMPTVFLRRIGGNTDGELYPIHGVMQPGTHKREVRVPAGEYEIDVLPLGAFEVLEGGSIDARPEKVVEQLPGFRCASRWPGLN